MWWPVLPQILLATVLLLVPGLVVALSLRFRSFEAFALAPALSVGILVVTSTGAPFLGVPFGVVPVGVVTFLLAMIGMLAGRLRPQQHPADRGATIVTRFAPFAAFVTAAGLLAWRTLQVIGSPGSISQTYDAVFHLNSVRFALDTGQASSLTIGAMTGGGFYPAGWNAVASLVASTTGADVPIAVNITNVILASVFWPLSCLLMTTWVAGRGTAATIATGIASASLGAFPLLMMDFGVLYPNLLAISILPASIALAAQITRIVPATKSPRLLSILALLLSLSGLVVSHPTTFMAWLVWTLPMVGFSVLRSAPALWKVRSANRRRLYLSSAGIAIYGLAFLALWIFLRPPGEASFWGPYFTVPQVIGESLLVSPMGLAPAWLVAPLALLGLWASFTGTRTFAWVGSGFLIFSGLYVVVASLPVSRVRSLLTGVWYNDSYRIAALLPVGAVLLVAIGVRWASGQVAGSRTESIRSLLNRYRGTSMRGQRGLRSIGVAALFVLAIVVGQQGGMQQEETQASTQYAISNDSPLVSQDELKLIDRLPETVPVDSVLLGNPYTGAALSYALSDRKAAQMHILSYVSPNLQEIYNALGAVTSDPKVCAAVHAENAFYVLDFGLKEVHGGSHTPPGLIHLEQNPGVKLIDSQGEARLYKITACGS